MGKFKWENLDFWYFDIDFMQAVIQITRKTYLI